MRNFVAVLCVLLFFGCATPRTATPKIPTNVRLAFVEMEAITPVFGNTAIEQYFVRSGKQEARIFRYTIGDPPPTTKLGGMVINRFEGGPREFRVLGGPDGTPLPFKARVVIGMGEKTLKVIDQICDTSQGGVCIWDPIEALKY